MCSLAFLSSFGDANELPALSSLLYELQEEEQEVLRRGSAAQTVLVNDNPSKVAEGPTDTVVAVEIDGLYRSPPSEAASCFPRSGVASSVMPSLDLFLALEGNQEDGCATMLPNLMWLRAFDDSVMKKPLAAEDTTAQATTATVTTPEDPPTQSTVTPRERKAPQGRKPARSPKDLTPERLAEEKMPSRSSSTQFVRPGSASYVPRARSGSRPASAQRRDDAAIAASTSPTSPAANAQNQHPPNIGPSSRMSGGGAFASAPPSVSHLAKAQEERVNRQYVERWMERLYGRNVAPQQQNHHASTPSSSNGGGNKIPTPRSSGNNSRPSSATPQINSCYKMYQNPSAYSRPPRGHVANAAAAYPL